MFKSVRGRVVTILVMVSISIFYLVNNSIKLGLDLQGGMHLVLEVDDPQGLMSPEDRVDAIDRAERILRTRIDEFGVEEPLIQKIEKVDRLSKNCCGTHIWYSFKIFKIFFFVINTHNRVL